MDVVKLDRGVAHVAYVAGVSETYCKSLFNNVSFVLDVCCKRFDLDVAYVSHICCNSMFHLFHSFIATSVFMLHAVRDKCSIWMLHMFSHIYC